MLVTPEDKTGTVQARQTTSFGFNTDLSEIYIAYQDMTTPTTTFQENQSWILKGQQYTDFINELTVRAPGASQALMDLTLEALPGGDTGNIIDA